MTSPANGSTDQHINTVINDSKHNVADNKTDKQKVKVTKNGRKIQKTKKTKTKTPIATKKYHHARKHKKVSLADEKTTCRLNNKKDSVNKMTTPQKQLLAEHGKLVTELKKFKLIDDAHKKIRTAYGAINKTRTSSPKKTYKEYSNIIKNMNLKKGFNVQIKLMPDNNWVSLIPPDASLANKTDLQHIIKKSVDMLNNHIKTTFSKFDPSQQLEKIDTIRKKLDMTSSNSNRIKEEINLHNHKNITVPIKDHQHTNKRLPTARHPVSKLTVSDTQKGSRRDRKDNKLLTPQPLPTHKNAEVTKHITTKKKEHSLTNLPDYSTNKTTEKRVTPRREYKKSKDNKENFNRQNTITGQPSVTKKQPSVYHITVNKRPGKEHINIQVPIANVSDLRLTKDNMPEIFRRANEVTLNKQYPIQNTSTTYNGVMVHRPNHNGTHSSRKVAHVKNLFSYIQARGSANAKNTLKSLTKSETNNLLIATYLMRAGRVDESSHSSPPPDNYKKRSAMIYEQYAQQLGEKQDIIDWTKQIILNSCLPSTARDPSINSNPKSLFGCEILSTAHDLDLVRCFPKRVMSPYISSIQKSLDYLSSDSNDNNDHMKFIEYSKNLCDATGSGRSYDNHHLNAPLFTKCSIDSGYCWKKIQTVQVPIWR